MNDNKKKQLIAWLESMPWWDELPYANLEAESDVLRNTISLLKNENERMMKLAHDYITAYEKLAFGEEQGDETE